MVHAYSREANDLGQWLFGLYVAVAVTAATRARAHLASDIFAHRYGPRTRARLARIGAAIGLLPWSLWLLGAGWDMAWRSTPQSRSLSRDL